MRTKSPKSRYKKADREFDVHVWVEPEDKMMVTLYTLSVGKQGICYHAPIESALKAFRRYLEESID